MIEALGHEWLIFLAWAMCAVSLLVIVTLGLLAWAAASLQFSTRTVRCGSHGADAETRNISLFNRFEQLRTLPHVSVGSFPTPVQPLDGLRPLLDQYGVRHAFIKRDDLSERTRGGGNVRKLEFILGNAKRGNVRALYGIGTAGSDFTADLAYFGKQCLGAKVCSVLMPQANSSHVRDNLVDAALSGSEFITGDYPVWKTLLRVILHYGRFALRHLSFPDFTALGGSSPLGTVGFVNAALELADQIKSGALPEPDVIYVACGTMGTATGLRIGLKVAGLHTKVVAVAVTDSCTANGIRELWGRTVELLVTYCPSFPSVKCSDEDCEIERGMLGDGFGVFSVPAMESVSAMWEAQHIALDGASTGKALAAMFADAMDGKLDNKTVLFWNTVHRKDRMVPRIPVTVCPVSLPPDLMRYFHTPVQELEVEYLHS